jgi:hypothetical protein
MWVTLAPTAHRHGLKRERAAMMKTHAELVTLKSQGGQTTETVCQYSIHSAQHQRDVVKPWGNGMGCSSRRFYQRDLAGLGSCGYIAGWTILRRSELQRSIFRHQALRRRLKLFRSAIHTEAWRWWFPTECRYGMSSLIHLFSLRLDNDQGHLMIVDATHALITTVADCQRRNFLDSMVKTPSGARQYARNILHSMKLSMRLGASFTTVDFMGNTALCSNHTKLRINWWTVHHAV